MYVIAHIYLLVMTGYYRLDVHNKITAAKQWERGTWCPQQHYCRQVMRIGELDVHNENYCHHFLGIGGLDVHNKSYCRRAMGMEGLTIPQHEIIAAG
jgi:hypothetical protein